MPSIQRLYDTLHDENIAFVCISAEDSDTVRKFVEKSGYTFPIYTIDGDRPEEFRTRGIPTTFLLSKDGKIAFQQVGSVKWDDQTSIDFINTLLDQDASQGIGQPEDDLEESVPRGFENLSGLMLHEVYNDTHNTINRAEVPN
jgi:hypothetical protein